MSYMMKNLLGKLRDIDQSADVVRIKTEVMDRVSELGFKRGFSWHVRLAFAAVALFFVLISGSWLTARSEPGDPLFAVRSSAEDTYYSTQTAVDITLAGVWNR